MPKPGVGLRLGPQVGVLSGPAAKHLGERAQEVRDRRRPALVDGLPIERMHIDSDWSLAAQIRSGDAHGLQPPGRRSACKAAGVTV